MSKFSFGALTNRLQGKGKTGSSPDVTFQSSNTSTNMTTNGTATGSLNSSINGSLGGSPAAALTTSTTAAPAPSTATATANTAPPAGAATRSSVFFTPSSEKPPTQPPPTSSFFSPATSAGGTGAGGAAGGGAGAGNTGGVTLDRGRTVSSGSTLTVSGAGQQVISPEQSRIISVQNMFIGGQVCLWPDLLIFQLLSAGMMDNSFLFFVFTKDLTQDNRRFIMEGSLTKICRKAPKQKRFFLFDDILVYGQFVSKKKLTKQVILGLNDMAAKNLPDDRGAIFAPPL